MGLHKSIGPNHSEVLLCRYTLLVLGSTCISLHSSVAVLFLLINMCCVCWLCRIHTTADLLLIGCAGWAMLLLRERVSTGAMIGGGLMIGATLLACMDSSVHGQQRK